MGSADSVSIHEVSNTGVFSKDVVLAYKRDLRQSQHIPAWYNQVPNHNENERPLSTEEVSLNDKDGGNKSRCLSKNRMLAYQCDLFASQQPVCTKSPQPPQDPPSQSESKPEPTELKQPEECSHKKLIQTEFRTKQEVNKTVLDSSPMAKEISSCKPKRKCEDPIRKELRRVYDI